LHINLSPEQHESLTLAPSVAGYPYYKCCLLAINKTINAKVTGYVTLIIERASYTGEINTFMNSLIIDNFSNYRTVIIIYSG
jgi:hypothetical protein